MTQKSRNVLMFAAVLAALLFLAVLLIGTFGYLAYKHQKQASDSTATAAVVDTIDHSAEPGLWVIDSAYNAMTGNTLHWTCVKDLSGKFDITIFGTGIVQVTRLDTSDKSPLFTCDLTVAPCRLVALVDGNQPEVWDVQPINDGASGAAIVSNPAHIINEISESNNLVLVYKTPYGNEDIVFNTHGCPATMPPTSL